MRAAGENTSMPCFPSPCFPTPQCRTRDAGVHECWRMNSTLFATKLSFLSSPSSCLWKSKCRPAAVLQDVRTLVGLLSLPSIATNGAGVTTRYILVVSCLSRSQHESNSVRRQSKRYRVFTNAPGSGFPSRRLPSLQHWDAGGRGELAKAAAAATCNRLSIPRPREDGKPKPEQPKSRTSA